MEELFRWAVTLYGGGEAVSSAQLNEANAGVLRFQQRGDALRVSTELLAQRNGVVLLVAASTVAAVAESADSPILWSEASSVLSVCRALLLQRAAQVQLTSVLQLQLERTLQRVFGALAARFAHSDWPACVADLCALADTPQCAFTAVGALERMADAVEKWHLNKTAPPSSGSSGSGAMQVMMQNADRVCRLASSAKGQVKARQAILRMLSAWIRVGAVASQLLVQSDVLSFAVHAVSDDSLTTDAVEVLSQALAPSVAMFRTVKSIAATSLSLDVPRHKDVVVALTTQLLALCKARTFEWDHAPLLVGLICDIVEKHPSLVLHDDRTRTVLWGFLSSSYAWRDFDGVASHAVNVLTRVADDVAGAQDGNTDGRYVELFTQVYAATLARAVTSRKTTSNEQEWRELRLQLGQVVLACGQVLGQARFFQFTQRADVEVALWAASCACVLHDGRTPFCLPDLFNAALNLDLNSCAFAACFAASASQAIVAYRGFIRNFNGGAMLPGLSRLCGRLLPRAPAEAASALLALCELCGEALAPDLPHIAPLVVQALPHVNSETAASLLGACAELANFVPDDVSAKIRSSLLESLISQAIPWSAASEKLLAAGVSFCDRSEGKCGAVYAQVLLKSWKVLQEWLSGANACGNVDAVCLFVCSLAVAAGSSAAKGFAPIAMELVSVASRCKSADALRSLRFFVTVDGTDAAVAAPLRQPFMDVCRACMRLMLQAECTGDMCAAFYDLLTRTLWAPGWRSAFCVQSFVGEVLVPALSNAGALCERFSSHTDCVSSVCDFQTELCRAARETDFSGDPGGNDGSASVRLSFVVSQVAYNVVLSRFEASLKCNPLFQRFHVVPMFEFLQFVARDRRRDCFTQITSRFFSEPQQIVEAARFAENSCVSLRSAKMFISDLANVVRGRESFDSLANPNVDE